MSIQEPPSSWRKSSEHSFSCKKAACLWLWWTWLVTLPSNSERNLARFWTGTCESKGAGVEQCLWRHTPWLLLSHVVTWICHCLSGSFYLKSSCSNRLNLEISLKKCPDAGKFQEAMRDKKFLPSSKSFPGAWTPAKTREVPMYTACGLLMEIFGSLTSLVEYC